ncbi:HAD family hydrolase [Paenibacillus marinisediminis]
MERPQAIIFDMDGTLFKTETLLIPAHDRVFNRLREEGYYDAPTPPVELMLGSLGMLLDEIWKRVIPDATDAARARADELLVEEELAGLREPGSELYPGVVEVLTELRKRGVKLFVASNGLEPYIQGVSEAHGILPLFDELYSAGGRQTASKVDLVRLVLDEHKIESAWMVGDRSSDVEAGKKNGLKVIGCAYADFGHSDELKDADVRIREFTDILKLYDEASA